jgi:hypothetical protein
MAGVDKGGEGAKNGTLLPAPKLEKAGPICGTGFWAGRAHFSEKWNLLPDRSAKAAGCGQILPGDKCIPAKAAGTVFPGRRKFDA